MEKDYELEEEFDLEEAEELQKELYEEVKFDKEKVGANDIVKIFLKEIGELPLLSFDEEFELTEKAFACRKAIEKIQDPLSCYEDEEFDKLDSLVQDYEYYKNEIISHNLRLVVSVAKHYLHRGLELSDLIQEGSLGLGKAVDKFDPTMGFRFSTYASWWIRQAINRAISEQGRTIRIPVHSNDEIYKLFKAEVELTQQYGREPTQQELSKATGFGIEKISLLKKYDQSLISLEKVVGEDDTTTLKDFVADTNTKDPFQQMISDKLNDAIKQALSRFKPREQEIIEYRFGLNGRERLTLEELGVKYGLTRERVRQIEEKVLGKIRRGPFGQQLRQFFADLEL